MAYFSEINGSIICDRYAVGIHSSSLTTIWLNIESLPIFGNGYRTQNSAMGCSSSLWFKYTSLNWLNRVPVLWDRSVVQCLALNSESLGPNPIHGRLLL